METAASDNGSFSIYDDDVNDMISGNLFTRDWKIVGTDPPASPEADNGGSDASHDTSHLVMFFEESPMIGPGEFQPIYNSKPSRIASPIVLDSSEPETVEILPISSNSLGMYYNYFASCVAQNRYDQLINVCRKRRKSPCFDIENCYLAVPHPDTNLDNFTTAEIDGLTCVPLIPSSIVLNMMDSLAALDIRVVPAIHDVLAYNGCRVRMSASYTDCAIDPSSWKGNTYTALFSRILRCKAVTTATLTVSMVLGMTYSRKSHYNNRKTLTIVVHAIK